MDPIVITAEDLKKETPKFNTEIIDLPSKGLLYPEDHPFSNGQVELKYMTAKEEDILSTQSYIKQGVVLDKLLQSLIVDNVDYNTILLGDRNAIMIAARRFGYGDEYNTTITREDKTMSEITINLNEIEYVEIDETVITKGSNEFEFITPLGKDTIRFSLLTIGKFNKLEKTLKSYKKAIAGQRDRQMTTRLRYMITSVNGDSEAKTINAYVESMLSRDSRAFRAYIAQVQPDLNLNMEVEDEISGEPFRGKISIGIDLFYPDFKA